MADLTSSTPVVHKEEIHTSSLSPHVGVPRKAGLRPT